MVDNSGLRITFTPTLRQYDAGMMEVGIFAADWRQVVPPHQDVFVSQGACKEACLEKVSKPSICETHITMSFLLVLILFLQCNDKHIIE